MNEAKSLTNKHIGFSLALTVGTLLAGMQCLGQTSQPSAPTNVATLYSAESADGHPTANNAAAKAAPAGPDVEIAPAVAKQLAAMQAQIDALKAELKSRDGASVAPGGSPPPAPAATSEAKAVEPSAANASDDAAQAHSGAPEKPKPADPFAYADWTWLNGNPRNKDTVWDSKFFTPEIRMDIHYIQDLNHP